MTYPGECSHRMTWSGVREIIRVDNYPGALGKGAPVSAQGRCLRAGGCMYTVDVIM